MEPNAYTAILYEIEDRIATITFDQPEVMNPMTPEMVTETIDALDRAAQDPEVLVLIITGTGRAFSAGGDVRGLGDQADGYKPTPFERRAWLRRTQRLILAIRAVEKPVLAAINGVAAGGGCDIALACDIRFMAEGARIGEIFAKIGLFPGTGGTWLLPRAVGVEKALELIWTAELVDAAEAQRIGLVGHVLPAPELLDGDEGVRQTPDGRSPTRSCAGQSSGLPGLGPGPGRRSRLCRDGRGDHADLGGSRRGHQRLSREATADVQGPLAKSAGMAKPKSAGPSPLSVRGLLVDSADDRSG